MKKSPHSATDFDAKIGRITRNKRIQEGLSGEALAAKIGTSHQQLYKYERGQGRIHVERMAKIAKALNRPISEFYPDEEVVYDGEKNRLMRNIMKGVQALDSTKKNVVRDLVAVLGGVMTKVTIEIHGEYNCVAISKGDGIIAIATHSDGARFTPCQARVLLCALSGMLDGAEAEND